MKMVSVDLPWGKIGVLGGVWCLVLGLVLGLLDLSPIYNRACHRQPSRLNAALACSAKTLQGVCVCGGGKGQRRKEMSIRGESKRRDPIAFSEQAAADIDTKESTDQGSIPCRTRVGWVNPPPTAT